MESNSGDLVEVEESNMQKLDIANDSVIVLERFPKSPIANDIEIIPMEKWQQKETHIKKGHKRRKTIKSEEVEHLESPNVNSSLLATRTKPTVRFSDLTKEPKDICDIQKDRKRKKSFDLTEDINNFKHVETRLDKIPKEILKKYGIVIEDCDLWKGSSILEEKMNLWSESRSEVDEKEEDEGKLIIDEDEGSIHLDEKCELSEIMTADNFSTKENSAGFTNCGHHIVISSVKSLQWNAACDKCEFAFPEEDSLKIHKQGHCTYPGCLDFIPDETERGKHLLIHKANPIKPFRCDYCKKRFRYYRFTKKHREICKVLKKIKCPYCSYSSTKINYLNKHLAKHVNKMYCSECRKTFIRVKKYVKHMFLYHEKEVWFQCPQCPLRFQQTEAIVKHIESHELNILKSSIADFILLQPIMPLK